MFRRGGLRELCSLSIITLSRPSPYCLSCVDSTPSPLPWCQLYQVVAMANNLSQSSTSPNRELIYPIIQITHRVSLFPCRLVIVYQDRPYFLVVYRGLGGADNACFISRRFAVAGHTRMLCRIWAGDWQCADAGSLSQPQATSARFVYGELTGQSPPWRFIIRDSIEYRW